MKTLPSVLQSAFWGAYRSDTSISLIHQEKVWTRLRWLGVLVWWLLISAPGATALQPVAGIVFGLGLVYCGFCHYVVYRLHRGRPLVVPVPLLDTALVSLMCGVSGGIDSPALAYFYVISLAVGIRFGSAAGLIMAALQALFCLELFALLSGTGTGIAPHPQIAYLFLAGGISAVLFPTQPSAAAQPTHRQASVPATEQLWSVNRALGSLDVDTVMQQLVDTLERLLACEGVGLILLDRRSGQAERIAVAGSFPVPASTALAASLAEGGLLRQVCDRGTLVLDTPDALQTWLQPDALHDIAEHNLFITPVMQPDYPQPLACLLVADRHPDEGFPAETVGLLTNVAQHTALAIENAQLYEGIEKETRQLRELLHTVIGTREEERKRLVEEWQAQLGEKLFSVLQDFRRSKDLFLQRVPEAEEQIQRLVAELDAMAAAVRSLMDELRPATLDDFGFVAALQEYVNKLRRKSLFRVTVQADDAVLPLASAATLSLFRITQEALEHIGRHANAAHVEIAVVQEHKGVSLLIKDDGHGAHLEQYPHGQYSLLYMRERAEACGGTLQVSSARNRGTEVRVSVPTA